MLTDSPASSQKGQRSSSRNERFHVLAMHARSERARSCEPEMVGGIALVAPHLFSFTASTRAGYGSMGVPFHHSRSGPRRKAAKCRCGVRGSAFPVEPT